MLARIFKLWGSVWYEKCKWYVTMYQYAILSTFSVVNILIYHPDLVPDFLICLIRRINGLALAPVGSVPVLHCLRTILFRYSVESDSSTLLTLRLVRNDRLPYKVCERNYSWPSVTSMSSRPTHQFPAHEPDDLDDSEYEGTTSFEPNDGSGDDFDVNKLDASNGMHNTMSKFASLINWHNSNC